MTGEIEPIKRNGVRRNYNEYCKYLYYNIDRHYIVNHKGSHHYYFPLYRVLTPTVCFKQWHKNVGTIIFLLMNSSQPVVNIKLCKLPPDLIRLLSKYL